MTTQPGYSAQQMSFQVKPRLLGLILHEHRIKGDLSPQLCSSNVVAFESEVPHALTVSSESLPSSHTLNIFDSLCWALTSISPFPCWNLNIYFKIIHYRDNALSLSFSLYVCVYEREKLVLIHIQELVIVLNGKQSRVHYVEFNQKAPVFSSLDFWPAAEVFFFFKPNICYPIKLWISKIYELARIILVTLPIFS